MFFHRQKKFGWKSFVGYFWARAFFGQKNIWWKNIVVERKKNGLKKDCWRKKLSRKKFGQKQILFRKNLVRKNCQKIYVFVKFVWFQKLLLTFWRDLTSGCRDMSLLLFEVFFHWRSPSFETLKVLSSHISLG